MNTLIYTLRFLYRIKYWIILCPIVVAIVLYMRTDNLKRQWKVTTTIYTGVVSGYDIESSSTSSSPNTSQTRINNAMDNLINIISSESTLKSVSMRLFARHMMYGDPNKDTKYISAKNFRSIYSKASYHKDVMALIDKTSEKNTVDSLFKYEAKAIENGETGNNFIFGLFNWTHQHYSHEALKKIQIKKLGSSDMLSVTYTSDDPAIAYNTLVILNEEFIRQYEDLRFGETNSVIEHFENELKIMSDSLRKAEDQLTDYNTANQVINFSEQTKYVAAMDRDLELRLEEILLENSGAKELVDSIERRIDFKSGTILNNIDFIKRINDITTLTTKITAMELLQHNDLSNNDKVLAKLKRELELKEVELHEVSNEITSQQYTTEGVSSISLIDQWLNETIRLAKTEAQLKIMAKRRTELNDKYKIFSPVGSTIKQKERDILFKEQSYQSTLNSLNTAKLRRKNLQMTSTTLKIINPPVLPVAAEPHSRRLIVAVGALATFIFILGIFIVLEIIDRTLRNVDRTQRLTSTKVLGALPKRNKFRYRNYEKIWLELAAGQIANKLMSNFVSDSVNIINILSTENNDGKSLMSRLLSEYWTNEGLNVKVLKAGIDFNMKSREFHLSKSLRDVYDIRDEDIIIVEYPSLKSSSVPHSLLNEAEMNIVAIRSNRSWKDTDQITLEHLKKNSDKVEIVLTNAERLIAEIFTGLLPPYTLTRRFVYRIYQFGFTSTESYSDKL